MTINNDKTLITMFTELVLRLCSSQYFWPKADFVLTTLGRNQKPRGQKSRGRIFGFFKPTKYPLWGRQGVKGGEGPSSA